MKDKQVWGAGLILCAGAIVVAAQTGSPTTGLFDGNSDVGTVLHRGSVAFDPSSKTYKVTGGGANIWAAEDDFQFVWKKVSAENVTLSAEMEFLDADGDHHRKGVLMIRQSLDPDSAYADVAAHGDGLTSLQFRDQKGGATHEIESNLTAPKRLEIRKVGDRFSMWVGKDAGSLEYSGASTSVALTSPFYVGIGVSAHDKDAMQNVSFTNVNLTANNEGFKVPTKRYSTLVTINVRSSDARVSYVTPDKIEWAEWSDDKTLTYSVAGTTRQIPASLYGTQSNAAAPASPEHRDNLVSPDGTQMLNILTTITGNPLGDRASTLAVISLADKKSKVLAKLLNAVLSPHPWSPDGKRVVYITYESM